MNSNELLNPDLYTRLCDAFGRANVKVNYAGDPGGWRKMRYVSDHFDGHKLSKDEGESGGEEFVVDCPFCGDTRKRLQINHRFGTEDPYCEKVITWTMNCFNEACHEDWENRKELLNSILYGEEGCLMINKDAKVKPRREGKLVLPKGMQNIHTLAMTKPEHPAVQFCWSRSFDTQVLAERYGVAYCPSLVVTSVAQRLVAPFWSKKEGKVELTGWTARAVTPDFEGPKWRHSYSAIGGVVYGLGEAMQEDVLVAVEGPGDKWGVGRAGAACFGKKVTSQKLRKIAAVLNKRPGKPCVVLLDPEMDAVQITKGKEHHNVVARKELAQLAPNNPILDVRLPIGTDPGSLDFEYMWDYIVREAKASDGITIPRGRPCRG